VLFPIKSLCDFLKWIISERSQNMPWWYYVLMALLLVGAIGLFWYVRNKQQ